MSIRSTTVLHIFGTMNPGGAELRTMELMRQLPKHEFTFAFLALSGMPGELDAEIEDLGGVIHHIRLNALFPIRFIKLVHRNKYAVHSHVATFSGLILLFARIAGAKIRIAHFRSDGDGKRNTLRRRLQRRAMLALIRLNATSICAVTEESMRLNMGQNWFVDRRCFVVPNGINPSRFPSLSARDGLRRKFDFESSTTVVLNVGRSGPAKNRSMALKVFAALAGQRACLLLFVGPIDEEELESLRELARRLKVERSVEFLGLRRDVELLLLAADLLLQPSIREGLPGAILEAAAVGTATLSSDVAGAVEIAKNLAGVRTMSLLEPIDAWVAEANEILDEDGGTVRIERAQRLRQSPYNVEQALSRLIPLWREG